MRAFSYGGGVQSTAALVLSARGRIDFPAFIFANVGDDSEDPLTLDYVARYAKPFAAAHGIDLVEVRRDRRDGTVETLYGRLTREGSRSLPIPVRMANGKPGTRSCTADFKIKLVGRWLKAHGARPDRRAVVGIGISLDEIERVNKRRAAPYETPVYPLIGVGEETGLLLRRQDCERIITAAGLPIPAKSACWFCPFHRPSTWAEMRRDRPELFARACDLETLLNERRDMLGRDHVYLTRYARPLADAIPAAQAMLPIFDVSELDDAVCDNGACFT
ncbi:hypothetical protein BJ964_001922 [Actinoplanes lobatus]|uniref:Phosphoadenosine phosphosulfate reductase n=1 Tax=Actinoplanes lobatus TaxID=113568 RepID=A0A7W7HC17_9ACTN|nr:hypothetical protein [Actinoplanes lobatus]